MMYREGFGLGFLTLPLPAFIKCILVVVNYLCRLVFFGILAVFFNLS